MAKVTKLLALSKKIKNITEGIKDAPKGKSVKNMKVELAALKAKLAEIESAKNAAAIKAAKSKATKARASIDSDAREVAGSTERSGSGGNAERDIEEGKAGEVTSGRRSEPTFADMETSSRGRTARNKRVATLETLKEKGTITKAEKTELDGLNAASARNKDKAVTSAAISNAANASKKKGVSLAGEDGKTLKVGQVVKQPSGQMIGDTKNGINRVTGEIFGTPTPNQFKMAMRDLEARTNLSAAVKRDRMAKLVKAAGRTKEQRQDATIANMERRMVDTGTDKSGRAFKKGGTPKKKKPTYGYSYGGMTTSKPRKGNTDYRMGGMFTKKGKK